MSRQIVCYNCGEKGHVSKLCTRLEQQFERCPACNVVAHSAASHKINCTNIRYVSQKIGSYELPFMEFHTIVFAFINVSAIYCEEKTNNGIENFLITKFISFGTRVKFRRMYSTADYTLHVKIKPSITIGFGRLNMPNMASFMFCDDQVRINHHQHIDKHGIVSYSLNS